MSFISFDNAKIQQVFEISKYFVLKNVNSLNFF